MATELTEQQKQIISAETAQVKNHNIVQLANVVKHFQQNPNQVGSFKASILDFAFSFHRLYTGSETLFAHDILKRLRASLVATTDLINVICRGTKDETEDVDHTDESEDLRLLITLSNTKFVEFSCLMGIYLFGSTASTDEQVDMFNNLFSAGVTTRSIIVLATEQFLNGGTLDLKDQLLELQSQLAPTVKAIASLFKRERAPQPSNLTMTQILSAAVKQVHEARLQFTTKQNPPPNTTPRKLMPSEENLLTQLTGVVSEALMAISQAYLKTPDKQAILSGILLMSEATKTVKLLTEQELVPLFTETFPEHVVAIQFCLRSMVHCMMQLLLLAGMIGLDYNPTNLHPHMMGLVIRHWCNMVNYMLGIVFVELHATSS